MVRPLLLAGALALMWFVQFQDSRVDVDAPPWAVALVLGVRLLADFIGAWVALSVARLVLAVGRMGLAQVRAHWQREG